MDLNELNRLTGHAETTREMGLAKCAYTERNGEIINRSDEILILWGLPERTFMGVLAHELMHVWCAHKVTAELSSQLSEGTANYASALIYRNSPDPVSQMLLTNLQDDPDPVYGVGYRQVVTYIDQYGLGEYLNRLQKGKIRR